MVALSGPQTPCCKHGVPLGHSLGVESFSSFFHHLPSSHPWVQVLTNRSLTFLFFCCMFLHTNIKINRHIVDIFKRILIQCRYSGYLVEFIFFMVSEYKKSTIKVLATMDQEKINYELIEALLEWIVYGDHEVSTVFRIIFFFFFFFCRPLCIQNNSVLFKFLLFLKGT